MMDGLLVLDGTVASALLLTVACFLLAFILAISQRRKQDPFFRPDFTEPY